jgi:hypothetical protein
MGLADKSGLNSEAKREISCLILEFRYGQPVDGYCADRFADMFYCADSQ